MSTSVDVQVKLAQIIEQNWIREFSKRGKDWGWGKAGLVKIVSGSNQDGKAGTPLGNLGARHLNIFLKNSAKLCMLVEFGSGLKVALTQQ